VELNAKVPAQLMAVVLLLDLFALMDVMNLALLVVEVAAQPQTAAKLMAAVLLVNKSFAFMDVVQMAQHVVKVAALSLTPAQ